MATFADFELSNTTLTALSRRDITEPTLIQSLVIPKLMKDSWHIVGQAQTGTGKTAAFGIPIIENATPSDKFISAVVVLPTRELALQCAIEINSFAGHRKINVVSIYGGAAFGQQVEQLKTAHVVVATPGRLLDHLRRGTIKLNRLQYCVLDEADEMLSMGFIDDIEAVMQQTNQDKQILMFSATFPKPLHAIARKYMEKYEHVKVDTENITNKNIEQQYVKISSSDRLKAVMRIVELQEKFYGIIFCSTKLEVDQVAYQLAKYGFGAEALHGDISQVNREKTLAKFKNNLLSVLVATDVAARGIDVKNITHVINYSFPRTNESYVHRIGRTGRAGKKGVAITLILAREFRKMQYMAKSLNLQIAPYTLRSGNTVVEYKKQQLRNYIAAKQEGQVIDTNYKSVAQELMTITQDPADLVALLLEHFAPKTFDPACYPEIKLADSHDSNGAVRLFFARGKEHSMSASKLVNFIAHEMFMEKSVVQQIKIMKSFSFFSVPTKEAQEILNHFSASGSSRRSLITVAKFKN